MTNTRYYGLDFARSVLMLLGIVYHSSLIFADNSQWHVNHPEQSVFFNLLTDFIHYFRMDAFYIIAGFFFVLVIEKYGNKATLIERTIKLAVPMLVIGLTLNAYLSSVHPEFHPTGSFNYFLNGQWVHHLWFIGNLIVYYFIAIWFVDYFKTGSGSAHSVKKIAFIAIVVAPCLWIALTWIGVRSETHRFVFVSVRVFLCYFAYFVLGMYLWQQRKQYFDLMTPKNAIILSLAALVLTSVLQTVDLKAISWTLYLVVSGLNGGILAIAMIMWLNYIGSQPSRLVSKLTASSYTVYLLHEPLIVFVYVSLIAAIELNLFVSFMLLCSCVFLITAFAHFVLIDNNKVLQFLFNGKLPKPAKQPVLVSAEQR